MTARDKSTIKTFFETGDKPTQIQFGDLIDSYQNAHTAIAAITSAVDQGGSGVVNIVSPTSVQLQTTGTVGLSILSAVTQASAQQAIGITATTAAGFATTAQAVAGAVDQLAVGPVNVRNAIQTFAFTSANYSTTAQAIAGTDATTVMNPVLVKNAISNGPSSGALIELISVTAASSVAALTITSVMDSTLYDNYVLYFHEVLPATDGRDIYIQCSDDGGLTWVTSALNVYSRFNSNVPSYSNASDNGGLAGVLVAKSVSNTAAIRGIKGKAELYQPSAGGVYGTFDINTSYLNNSGYFEKFTGIGQRGSGNPYNGLRVIAAGGDIKSGSIIRFYGVKK